MQIQVNVQLGRNQNLNLTPNEAASAVISALGGDEEVDHCLVYITTAQLPGEAGTPPPTLPTA